MTSRRLIRISLDDLSAASGALLRKRGFARSEAADIARYCTRATAEGHLEHGIGVLWVLDQQDELTPGHGPIRVDIRGGQCVCVSARRHLGFLPATRAVEALGRLTYQGNAPASAIVVSRGFRGRLGHIVRPLAMRGLIGIAIAGTAPVVAYKSRTPALGTNPIAIAVPLAEGVIVSDVAMAATTFTRRFMRFGSLETRHNPPLHLWGGHRGMAVSVAIQALSAAVTGVPLLPDEHWGLMIIAIPTLKSQLNKGDDDWGRWIARLGIHKLPGQRSDMRRKLAEKRGVRIPEWLWKWITSKV